MEIQKTSSISVDYKDRRSSPSWQTRLHAEVILIDKTHDGLHPIIYQLKDGIVPTSHQINYWKSGAVTLPDEAFIRVGEAQFIDKKKKQITLTNENIVGYNYLIIASGSKPVFSFNNEKFIAAIQALTDALRVKQKIPSSFATQLPSRHKARLPIFTALQHLPENSEKSDAIDHVAQPQICQSLKHKLLGPDLQSINKRLYEVHI